MPQTLLALGAHYDDCVFGVPGVMIKAARKGWRVVIICLIGDYTNFGPARDRSDQLKAGTIAICRDFGAELRFLELKGHAIEVTTAAQRLVAEAVRQVPADVGLLLWPHDRHGDHGPASRLSEVALRHAGPLLDDLTYRPPRRLYAYDNGPRHTIGFEPDTFVDVTAEWPAAIDWLGRLMELAHGPRAAAAGPHPALELKQAIAAYRGATCGVRHAEALRALNAYPQELF